MHYPSPRMPQLLPGELRFLEGPLGPLACHVAGPENAPALLLVHSINAAASAHEVAPLYRALSADFRVFAPDLPGFGQSARPAAEYTPAVMVDAIARVVAEIRREQGAAATIDALALSLSCEFLARAAAASPSWFRSLALVSPTGFSGRQPLLGPPGATRAMPGLRGFFTRSPVGAWLFRLLVRPGVIRYFLRRTWGRREIDPAMFEDAVTTAHQPGAMHAPICFLCGYFFGRDMTRIYRALQGSVWMAHGIRGDFVDYQQKRLFEGHPGWEFSVRATGALPWFEEPEAFVTDYRDFLARASVAADRSGQI
jgi:pimeloyl-ACP methyl ester carboxylesterase